MGNKRKDVIDYVLNYIFKYQKTEQEVLIQLRKKWYTEHHIKKAIDYLKEKNYLNDKDYIESYIYSNLIKKWKPIVYVKTHLAQKWVNMWYVKEIIWEHINEINEGIWKQIIKEIEKYKARWENQIDILQKITRKGYTLTQVKKAIEKKEKGEY